MSRGRLFACVAAIMGFATLPSVSVAATLDRVKERSAVQCGVNRTGDGVSTVNATGDWVGFFADFCRAVAAATLGSASAVEFVELNQRTRFDAIHDGAVDLFSANTTWTLSRDAAMGLEFTGTLYYDGQGFIGPVSLHAKNIKELKQATVCVTGNTTTENNLSEYIKANRLDFKIITLTSNDTSVSTFFSRRCDLYTTDRLALAGVRAGGSSKPNDYIIFPEIISKEPLGPVVRNDDAAWFAIVKWVGFAMIAAEEKGVSSTNLARMRDSSDPEVRRLLGVDAGLGKSLGLDETWASRVIEQVGNYGEVFDRNLGVGSPLRLERGLNALWTNGGLIYAPPLR
ncbi:general L-amino acid transport system substrate-binding protein [Rhizobiales bacterium GAS113]|nr:general L-amino acid transport system substrate-binding protein [Rhizobiales bacterium GAS113]